MRKYRNYSDEDVIKFAAQAQSMGQLLDMLELRKAGGNYAQMKKTLQRLDLKCEHWIGEYGKAWGEGEQKKDWSQYAKIHSLKKHLLKLRPSCEECGLVKWRDKPLMLEVHHKNGNRTDNNLENLQVLCPNCHSLTENFRNRKIK